MINERKQIPLLNENNITSNHINTGYTYTCILDSEIIIYRTEEWFKVLIHESMHNFGFDFSGMDINNIKTIDLNIKNIFNIRYNYELLSFESYAEFWAIIIHTLFYTYYTIKNNDDSNYFLQEYHKNINIERIHGYIQVVKILRYYGINYNQFIINNNKLFLNDINLPPIISYFLLKQILLYDYNNFIIFCLKNNIKNKQNIHNAIIFNKTKNNLMLFYYYIKDNYLNKQLLKEIQKIEKKNNNNKNNINMSCLVFV
jgi:hypothetical protein